MSRVGPVKAVNRRVELVEGRFPGTGLCPLCYQDADRYVRFIQPAFITMAGASDAPPEGILTQHEGEHGEQIYRTTSSVAGEAYREQVRLVDFWMCEGCVGGAAELIGYGDTLEAEAARDEAVRQRDEARKQTDRLERRALELEDALHASRMARLEAEASLASATRTNGHADADEPARKPAKRKAAA